VASCFYAPHVVVFVLTGVAVLVHDAVVSAEERYLAARHGQAWAEYRSVVRRYL
jgi:protein-S-isoprenylcysteine O-methyltransferase Ste14